MQADSVRKVMKILSPLSCVETRAKFDELLREKLSGPEEEWVQEHFLVCDECLDLYTSRVSEKVDTGEIPLREWPRHLQLPLSFSSAARQALGTIWEEVKAQGQAWAAEQRETLQHCLEGAMALWGIPTRAEAHLGKAPPVPAMGGHTENTTAEVVDENWQPQGTTVLFEVTDSPRITADGHFMCALHTTEQQWQERRMMCTLSLVSGQRLSFTSTVERDSSRSCSVRFHAEGLPQKTRSTGEVTVPLKHVQLWILTPSAEAA